MNFHYLRNELQKQAIEMKDNVESLSHDVSVILFEKIITEINTQLNPVEQIKKFRLLDREWTVETGELTPKMSMRRKVILQKYADIIEQIYN